jgi:pilus assembly protein CpaE
MPSVPHLCILEVEQTPNSAAMLIPELLKLDPKLGIVTVLPPDRPGLILPCLRMGATDFLTVPFTPDRVQAAAQKLIKLFPPSDPASNARIYSIFPAKGACGATTLACNLAFEYKRMSNSRVLLADLDPFTGTVNFVLKVKSTFSFMDVLNRAADMDADLWKAMVTDSRGLDVLLSPEISPEGASEMLDASPILDYARSNYSAVIVDGGHGIGEWAVSQAQLSDDVLLVSTNELTSLHCAQRAIQYLETNGIERWKIKLILNRFDEHFGVSRELVQDALAMEVFHVLPNDEAAVQKSLMDGKPIAPVSRLGKSIAALAQHLSGRERAPKASSMAGLRALFSRASS